MVKPRASLEIGSLIKFTYTSVKFGFTIESVGILVKIELDTLRISDGSACYDVLYSGIQDIITDANEIEKWLQDKHLSNTVSTG